MQGMINQLTNDQKLDAQSGSLEGISIGNFLQLIEMEKKTCIVALQKEGGREGEFYFIDGVIVDAAAGGLKGEPAALNMVGWTNARIHMKETPPGWKAPVRIKKSLMSLLMEGARIQDEDALDPDNSERNGAAENHVDIPAREMNKKNERKGENPMAGLKALLQEMAQEMDGVIALGVIGMDGISVAEHNPTGADADAFSAKFAMVLKLASKSTKDIRGLGEFEENLVQTQNAWVLTRYLNNQYFLGIAVSREGTLGNIRLVAQKYTDNLLRSL